MATRLSQVILRDDERVVRDQEARLLQGKERWRGRLYLTNKRLMFERRRGTFFKKYDVAMDARLDDLTYVKITGILRKRLLVGVRRGAWVDVVHLRVDDSEVWAAEVASLIKNSE